jgi:hypothetical protein
MLPSAQWPEIAGTAGSARPTEAFDSPSALIVKLFSHVVEVIITLYIRFIIILFL